MASFFRARRSDAGGEMLIHRDGESGTASWISRVVAGAGRLASSVFKSDSPSPSSSYSYSDDEESSVNSYEGEDMDVHSKEPNEPMMMEKKLEAAKDCGGTSLAIISEIESKQAIEQLLMQETFSRDEGTQLIKLIESRVVEVGKDGICKGPNSSTCNAMSSPGNWELLNLSRKPPISCSSGSPHAISPGSPRVLAPRLRSSVGTEAKDFEVEGSPVDVAKSYMQSVSPWRSKSSRRFRFEKQPCTEMHLPNDESPSTTPTYHASPSKHVLKRSHDAFVSRDTADEIRRLRVKPTVDKLDDSRFKLVDLSKRYTKDKACRMSSVADELIHGSPNTEETVTAVQSSHETSSLGSLPLKTNYSVGTGLHICDPAASISDGNQSVKAPWSVKAQLDGLSDPCITSFPSPTSMEHDGSDRSETLLYHEAQKLPSIDINSPPSLVFSMLSDVEAGPIVDGVCTSSIQLSHGVEYSPLGRDLISCDNETHHVADSIQQVCEAAEQDGKDQMQGKATGQILATDGSSAGLNQNDAANVSDGELATIISERTSEPLSADDTSILVPKKTNNGRARSASRGGSRAKPVKDPPYKPEPKASTSRGRGRKSVPGARRGRGKQVTPDTGI